MRVRVRVLVLDASSVVLTLLLELELLPVLVVVGDDDEGVFERVLEARFIVDFRRPSTNNRFSLLPFVVLPSSRQVFILFLVLAERSLPNPNEFCTCTCTDNDDDCL